ncbi:Fatty acid desaturase [Spongiibacter sp. IMCC21906]|uniref:alkane 1-monooxygenase n=1 Tax=Spongiibacter sp. IMCC21906 TaxID=1620392 RepID=UPI00062DF495|nr:alkane 1-monooxygenase [Spongiibacter sp. IMCC21906]AKH68094.1 Fatty acid desaturase [Spongiibacter sp. IMCC21906]
MKDYIIYYLSPLTILVSVVGLVLGGGYVWLGLATLPALALGDAILPRDLRTRNIKIMWLAYVPVVITSILAASAYFLLSMRVGEGGLTAFNTIGAVISTGWTATIVGIPAFHEMFHRRDSFLRNFGLCFQVFYMDPTRDIAHVVGHHIDVGTNKDGDTARRGQSLYAFGVEAMIHSFVTSQRMESDSMERRGFGRWSIRHRIWKGLAALIVFGVVMFLIGGWQGMAACYVAGILARFLLEAFNYFQHYGQVRVEGEPIEKRHVWNHLGALSRAMTFEITNHADHHLNSYMPYYELKPDVDAVKLPSVFTCFMAAIIPPVWTKFIIMPALREWDLNHANDSERAIAKTQNKAAGWPDWFAN